MREKLKLNHWVDLTREDDARLAFVGQICQLRADGFSIHWAAEGEEFIADFRIEGETAINSYSGKRFVLHRTMDPEEWDREMKRVNARFPRLRNLFNFR